MKYIRLLAALAILCLIAIPALSAQVENSPIKNAETSNGCKINYNGNSACGGTSCTQNCNENTCQNGNEYKTRPQDGTGNRCGNGQNGNQQGARDGSCPKRDGCCGNCKRLKHHCLDGICIKWTVKGGKKFQTELPSPMAPILNKM